MSHSHQLNPEFSPKMSAIDIPVTLWVERIVEGDRQALSRAITLIESNRKDDRQKASDLMTAITRIHTPKIRIGISGAPGVGKSTFIEDIGTYLTTQESSVAVLTIDPSSTSSGGSILGDKTRMTQLAKSDLAFIRPSANKGYLGGITHSTYDTMLLCEAAGFTHIFIETVGVGQSEIDIRWIADTVLILVEPGAGDDLQSIKRGIVEIADAIIITKKDIKPMIAEQTLHIYVSKLSGKWPASTRCWLHAATDASSIVASWQNIEALSTQVVTHSEQIPYWIKRYAMDHLAAKVNIDLSRLPQLVEQVQKKTIIYP